MRHADFHFSLIFSILGYFLKERDRHSRTRGNASFRIGMSGAHYYCYYYCIFYYFFFFFVQKKIIIVIEPNGRRWVMVLLKAQPQEKNKTGRMEDDDLKLLPRPKRALTAYNYFFHYLRAKLLSGEVLDDSEGEVNDDNVEEGNDDDDNNKSKTNMKDDDDNKSDQNESGSKAGSLPPSGSKISFANLGKAVGRRWHQLTDEQRQEFVQKAALDKERYNKEMVAYTEQQKNIGKLRKKEMQQEKKKQRKNDTAQRKKKTVVVPVQPIASATTSSSLLPTVAADVPADNSNSFPPMSSTASAAVEKSSTFTNSWSRSNPSTGIPHQYNREDPVIHPRTLTAATATASTGTSDTAVAAPPISQSSASTVSGSNTTPYSVPFSYYAQRPNTESYCNPYYPYEPQTTYPTTSGPTTSAYDAYYYLPQPYSGTVGTGSAYDHQYSSMRLPMPYYHQQPYTHHNRSHTTSGYGRQDTSTIDVENPNDINDPQLPSRTARFVTF
jgi:hypothetical protein